MILDIQNYYETTNIISDFYYKKYKCENQPFSSRKWLSNDIEIYMNMRHPILNGYHERYYKCLMRYVMCRHKRDCYKIAIGLYNVNENWEIKFHWGLLTPLERNGFIKEFIISSNRI